MEQTHTGYIIWEPSSHLPPTKVFANKSEAIKIAYHMAGKNPAKTFYVAKLEGCAKTQNVSYKDIEA